MRCGVDGRAPMKRDRTHAFAAYLFAPTSLKASWWIGEIQDEGAGELNHRSVIEKDGPESRE